MWVFCLHVCMPCACSAPWEARRRVSNLLKLELEPVGSGLCAILVLGTEPTSSAKVANVLNHWAMSPASTSAYFEDKDISVSDFYNWISLWNLGRSFTGKLLTEAAWEVHHGKRGTEERELNKSQNALLAKTFQSTSPCAPGHTGNICRCVHSANTGDLSEPS